MNANFKNIQNTDISQTNINPIINDNQVLDEYGIFSPDSFVYTSPTLFNSNNILELNLEQVLRAKTQASTIGLLITPHRTLENGIPYGNLSANGRMVLPVQDNESGANTLLNLLSLNGKYGNQCLLKFSLYGIYQFTTDYPTSSDSGKFPIYLTNEDGTAYNVVFAENSDPKGSDCLIFGIHSVGPYSYVVATNISETGENGIITPKIEFRTIVYSVCCNGEPNNPNLD